METMVKYVGLLLTMFTPKNFFLTGNKLAILNWRWLFEQVCRYPPCYNDPIAV